MFCPRDGATLEPRRPSDLDVFWCTGCSGCWLDYVALYRTAFRMGGQRVDLQLRECRPTDLSCPRCQEALVEGEHVQDQTLLLNQCSRCQGVWCDPDELERLLTASARGNGSVALGGRFKLGEPLARGRFSVLHRAVDLVSETPVVIRRYDNGDGPQAEEARLQMLREGRVLSLLSHRNLPRVNETIEDESRVCLVLDDFDGWLLDDYVEGLGQPASEGLLWRLLEQLLAVAAYLHSQNPPIVHRDLRPDSILITRHATLMLTDFGLATMRDEAPARTVFRALGSPQFAAPEQLFGAPSQPRNDIYSIGTIMYFLATATVPPPSPDILQGSAVFPSLQALRPDLSTPFVEIVQMMMHPDMTVRPSSVQAIYDLLRTLQGLEDETGAPVTAEAKDSEGEAVEEVEPAEAPQAAPSSAPPEAGRQERRSIWSKLFGKGRREGASSYAPTGTPDSEELEKYPLVDLAQMELERETALILPETVARSIQGICIGRRSSSEITVAVKDPTQVHIYDHVSYGTQGRFRPTLVRADALLLDLAQQYIYRLPQFAQQLPWLEWLERKKLEAETLDVKNAGEVTFGVEDVTSPIIAAVDRIIKEAISSSASDIHLETFEKEMVVRYRIDGVLNEISTFEPREAGAVMKRLKILANLDIAQDRVTQGGRISVAVAGQELDLRVSIVPVPYGESAVLRLLKKGSFNLTLKDLGFNEIDETRFRKVLSQPYGMVLVSGPTGSGKSTTLYASLAEIRRPDRKLLTIEDPIEYQMPRITQVQVNTSPREEDKKVTFARALREFLRQDPDVILVGEIRDPETAAISVQAALTGHMLLSTIHTNDSVGIIARLRDMGVEPYLIGSVLLGGVAQRLCRKICRDCREEIAIPPGYRELVEKECAEEPHLFHGRGCQTCHGTGYRGRVGLYEILEIGGEVRELISGMARDEAIREAATAHGFRTLYQDGLSKAAAGLVTLDEVQRVCMSI